MFRFEELMETFVIITSVLGFVQLLLHQFNIDFIEKSMFKFFDYCNGNQLIYLFFSIGLLAAMIVYYRNDIKLLCKDIRDNKLNSEQLKIFGFMTVPAILVFGILSVFSFYRITFELPALSLAPRVLIPNLILIAIAVAMFFCDKKENSEKKITKKDAIVIGLAQLLSIIPGIVRLDISFITMRYLGFSRIDSFKNFVLLSLPLQIGSCIFQAIDIGKRTLYLEILWPLVGGVIIFAVSLALLHFINWFLKKFTLLAWVIYRIFMGSLVLIYFLTYVYPDLDNMILAKEPMTEVKTEEVQ